LHREKCAREEGARNRVEAERMRSASALSARQPDRPGSLAPSTLPVKSSLRGASALVQEGPAKPMRASRRHAGKVSPHTPPPATTAVYSVSRGSDAFSGRF